VGAVKKIEMALEDYGYLMERIILFATDLDLGTCWMGGTFNKSNFARKIAADDDELVPAVTPIGCITENRGMRDRLIRLGAGSKKRLPREILFFHGSFDTPLSETDAGNYAVPLEMVRLGPSASNKQPWRIVKEKGRPVFHLFLQRTRGYDKNSERFQTADLQRLDMGIAMCHLELTAKELNLEGKWEKSGPPAIQLPERTHYIATWKEKK
jgi:hypothetical protein